jgi:hypothetical protein
VPSVKVEKEVPMQFNPQFGLYPILRELVNSSLKNQYKHQQNKGRMSPVHWLKEFCTIKLGASRQMGHTTASLKVMSDYFVNPLFLTTIHTTVRFAEQISHELPSKPNYKPNIKFYNIHQMVEEYKIIGQGSDYDAIFVDNTFRLKDNDYKTIEELAIRCMDKHESFCLVYLQ